MKAGSHKDGVCVNIVKPIFGLLTSKGACAAADAALDAMCVALDAAAVGELGINPVADAAAAVCDAVAVPFNAGCDTILGAILDGAHTPDEEAEAFCSAHF